jgi:hypothetical protein
VGAAATGSYAARSSARCGARSHGGSWGWSDAVDDGDGYAMLSDEAEGEEHAHADEAGREGRGEGDAAMGEGSHIISGHAPPALPPLHSVRDNILGPPPSVPRRSRPPNTPSGAPRTVRGPSSGPRSPGASQGASAAAASAAAAARSQHDAAKLLRLERRKHDAQLALAYPAMPRAKLPPPTRLPGPRRAAGDAAEPLSGSVTARSWYSTRTAGRGQCDGSDCRGATRKTLTCRFWRGSALMVVRFIRVDAWDADALAV